MSAPATIRQRLLEIFTPTALAEAERLIYPALAGSSWPLYGAKYQGATCCPLGVAAACAGLLVGHPRRTDPPPKLFNAPQAVEEAMWLVAVANDRGDLAAPGSLTRLLDQPAPDA